ncbi:MAG: PQQ-binding-like beta-propeller repeat protein, partial [Burkholderiales bacterium]|nr:PQQ-binding-like beta-propeller repeat protein [Burkholderiales bacterium]
MKHYTPCNPHLISGLFYNYLRNYSCLIVIVLLFGCATDNTLMPNPNLQIKSLETFAITWNISTLSKSFSGSFAPVMDQDNAIFTADSSGFIYKFDSSDGTTIFSFNIKHKLSSGTAVSSDTIFVTTQDDYLLAIGKATHEVQWQVKLPTISIEAPQVVNDIIVVRTNDGSLLAYNTQTGALLWVFQRPIPTLTLRATSTFQVSSAGDILVYGQPGGRLSVINVLTGVSIWDSFVALPVGATDLDKLTDINMRPVINNDDRTICVGTYNGRIGCVDAISSNTVWSKEFSTSVQLLVDKQNLYA